MNCRMGYEIIERRALRILGRGANSVMVLQEDGTRQAYVSLPFTVKKKKKDIKKRLRGVFQRYGYIFLRSGVIKYKKNSPLKKLLKRPDYGYIYWLKRLFRRRHVDLVFSEPNTLYPVITEGAAMQQYALYAGELKTGIWWD